MDKVLVALLREGQSGILFDNVPDAATINSPALARAMTSDSYQSRLLGQNKTVTLPTQSLWLFSGNNIILAGDMSSRIVRCEMDARVERPDQRAFSRDLSTWVSAHRAKIVQAGLTIILGYAAAGEPAVPAEGTRFREWAATVQRPIIWAGGADVGRKFSDAYADDPRLAALRELLTTWRDVLGDEPKTAKGLLESFEYTGLNDGIDRLRQAISGICGNSRRGEAQTAAQLSKALAAHKGKLLNGLRLSSELDRDKVTCWRVECLH